MVRLMEFNLSATMRRPTKRRLSSVWCSRIPVKRGRLELFIRDRPRLSVALTDTKYWPKVGRAKKRESSAMRARLSTPHSVIPWLMEILRFRRWLRRAKTKFLFTTSVAILLRFRFSSRESRKTDTRSRISKFQCLTAVPLPTTWISRDWIPRLSPDRLH